MRSTELSLLDFERGDDPKEPLEVCFLQKRPRSQIEVILVVKMK